MIARHQLRVLASASLLLWPVVLHAQGRLTPQRVDSIVTAGMERQHLVGVSVAIVSNGAITYSRGYGHATLSPAEPVDTGTRFSIGSVTKEFVAVLALLLQQDGKLSVNDTLAKWYPNLTRAREIRLIDLINHVSGYRDYYPLDYVDREMSRKTTADAIIREYATRPLDFAPGTRWSYSNTGYTILGRIIERAGGKPLREQLAERIFQPLGMQQTSFEPAPRDRRATGYWRWALGDPEPAPPEGEGWIGAAGGIWSTANDLARWDLALMRPGFLTPASRAILFGERMLADGSGTRYAGGLSVNRTGGRTVFSHGGATSGFSATNVFVPDDSAAVIILSNSDQNIGSGALLELVSPPRLESDAQRSQVQPPRPAPTPNGATAIEAAVAMFSALQSGSIDRAKLSPDYNWFLTRERLAAASRSLKPLGEPTRAEVLGLRERGGMQVATVRIWFGNRSVSSLMYRQPSGIVEQYLLW